MSSLPFGPLALCTIYALLAACSTERQTDDEGGGLIDTLDGQDEDESSSESDELGDISLDDAESGESGEDEDSLPCDEELWCDSVCCNPGESCVDGVCQLSCEDDETLCGGVDPVCCDAEELCYIGRCITPGAECEVTSCATRDLDQVCDEGEICDVTLGYCVPKLDAADCEYIPPESEFSPTPLFTWGQRKVQSCSADSDCQTAESCNGGSCEISWPHVEATDEPDYYQVTSLPVVVDLDDDCVPEVIFNSYSDSNFTRDGILRAIRGDNGAPLWTVSDVAYRTNSTSNPAVGDLDGDGVSEVISQGDGSYLVAVDGGDGTPLWRSDNFTKQQNSGSPAIANLDGEGRAEVIFGASVFDADGKLLWEGDQGIGIQGQGPISCIADLDGDGRAELIAGKTAYEFTGTAEGGDFSGSVRWNASIGDGYCGIADFDLNGKPEVAVVTGGTVHILNGTDGSTFASLAIPGGGAGGAPNIADFDGDGRPDVGTAGQANYMVARFNGTGLEVMWLAATQDASSQRTGSSVFDFDGDGRAEVVYNDELRLRIYPGVEPDCLDDPPGPGCDGMMTEAEVLFSDLNSSRTRTEYPVIADVNGDFKAEIVFATNNEADSILGDNALDAGIEVWKDETDNWVPTRAVWNQHSYHVTNVELNGGIPEREDDNWSTPEDDPYNNYRSNAQGAHNYCAPDLVPADLLPASNACPELAIRFWVLNQGCLGVGRGVKLSVWEETLALLNVLETQGPLAAGAGEAMQLTVPDTKPGEGYVIRVIVDDDGDGDGALNECREDNNESDPLVICKPPS